MLHPSNGSTFCRLHSSKPKHMLLDPPIPPHPSSYHHIHPPLIQTKSNMITLSDFYHVLTAVVPLYAAMLIAYASVKWWRIFTPDQCSGINRFVALFAVPLLSFHFISSNNPYTMNLRFLAADSLQKMMVLATLFAWAHLSRQGRLEWSITLFSLATLPNTLVMGIPLLKGMYGDSTGTLMVQIVVLQCIIWYTLMLFLFEYRGARLLIAEQFPDTGGSIANITVDADVLSLADGGREMIETEAEVKGDGKLHVTVRRSNASRSDVYGRRSVGLSGATPRPSSLTNADIYSLQSSRNPTPRGSSFGTTDFYSMVGRSSNFAGVATPRASNYEEDHNVGKRRVPCPAPTAGRKANGQTHLGKSEEGTGKDVHVVWSYNGSPVSDGFEKSNAESGLPTTLSPGIVDDLKENHYDYAEEDDFNYKNGDNRDKKVSNEASKGVGVQAAVMPPTSVMTRLILIMVWRKLIRNPNTYSSLIGIIWSLISFRWNVGMPTIISGSIAILSDAGLGMAMFSLGLFMALQPRMIACGNSTAGFAMAMRFLVGPAVMAAASIAVGLRGVLLHVAIVQASLPQGIVPFVFAKEYGVHPDILSTAVIFGMLIALPITLVYYILLGLW